MKIQGKTAIITGSSSGIGAATARTFAQKGANLILASRSKNALEKLKYELGENNTLSAPTDVTNENEVNTMVTRGIERFGRIDILINNAGVGIAGKVSELPIDNFMKGFATNVLGPVYVIKAVVPHMRQNGGGIIANVSSMVTKIAIPSGGSYRATKLALDALTDAARLELKKDGIRVITIYPGLTKTNFSQNTLRTSNNKNTHPPKNLKGRAPEFVAKRILWGIEKEHRAVYMNLRGKIATIIGTLTPQLFEWMIMRRYKNH